MVIFDTNVLVSAALIRGSQPDVALRATLARGIPLLFSKSTYEELAEVLMRGKFDRYVSRVVRAAFLDQLNRSAIIIADAALRVRIDICRDPTDNRFLELAFATASRFLVTGDADLLVLDPFRKIRILTVGAFLEVMAKRGEA